MNKKILPTKVDDTGFTPMLNRLGSDCSPSQFVREFVKNSIEAIQRTPNKKGNIVVDCNWDIKNPQHPEVFKLSFTDTGDGMSGDELKQNINHLSSSGHKNEYENFGMGAKIAAFTRNKAGITYESWKDSKSESGAGIMVHFNEEAGAYGIAPVDLDGNHSWVWPPAIIPDLIKKAGHGTRVTLYGQTTDADTMAKPENSIRGSRDSWLTYAINSKFFTIPDNIKIAVRYGYYRNLTEGNVKIEDTRHNWLYKIKGQKKILDDASIENGTVQVNDAKIHWWILKQDRKLHEDRERCKGHCGLLHQGEVVSVTDSRTNNKCIHFGVIIGLKNIAMYVEPDPKKYEQDSTRSKLRPVNGGELPWERWYQEFRDKMPEPIAKYISDLMGKTSDSQDESIRKRLKEYEGFFKISRYQPNIIGSVMADPDSAITGLTGNNEYSNNENPYERDSSSGRIGKTSGSTAAEILSSVAAHGSDGIKSRNAAPDPFPDVKWTSLSDGTRDEDDTTDRAARYEPGDHIILANADFQGFQDVIKFFCEKLEDIPHAAEIVIKTVRNVYAQTLMETVAGALALKHRPNWNDDDVSKAYSQEALTAACMNRSYQVMNIKRQLGADIKRPVDISDE